MSNPDLLIRLVRAILTWPRFSLTSFLMVDALKRQGITPKSVIDVGANVGQFSIAANRIFGDIVLHSFEPGPSSFEELKKNTASLENVRLYRIALGEQEGDAVFHMNAHEHSSSLLSLAQSHLEAFPEAHETGVTTVPLSTLDTVFGDLILQSPVLLKIDVQGYEAMVLKGARSLLRRVDYVVLEASLRPLYDGEMLFSELIRLMEEFGFHFLRPVGFLAHPQSGEVLQLDALFSRNR